MGVPRHFPTSTENSTRFSYDDSYIQKIPARTKATPRPSVAMTYIPSLFYFNTTTKSNYSYSDSDRAFIHKRFQEIMNSTDLLNSDWLSSMNSTIDYSSLYKIPLPTKIKVVFQQTPTWKFYLSAPTILFFVMFLLKIFVCYQRVIRTDHFARRRLSEEHRRPSVSETDPQPPNEISPPPAPAYTSSIIIDPEFSAQNNSHLDIPPSYSQCAVNNVGVVNKIVDDKSADLPPPYSTCIGALNETSDLPKVHKGQSGEEQSSNCACGM